jgi:hypothetical protein
VAKAQLKAYFPDEQKLDGAWHLFICASGLPSPNDFKLSSIAEIKQYPNCIVGKEQELVELYQYLNGFIN